jgi:hypothetical protein
VFRSSVEDRGGKKLEVAGMKREKLKKSGCKHLKSRIVYGD